MQTTNPLSDIDKPIGHDPSSRIVWESTWNGAVELVFQRSDGFAAAHGRDGHVGLYASKNVAVDALIARRTAHPPAPNPLQSIEDAMAELVGAGR